MLKVLQKHARGRWWAPRVQVVSVVRVFSRPTERREPAVAKLVGIESPSRREVLGRTAVDFHEAPVVLPGAGVVPGLRNVQFSGQVHVRVLAVVVMEVERDVGVPHAGDAHAAVPGSQYNAVCDK